jgi:hypothetical protein
MASAVYPKALISLFKGDIDLETADVKAVLLSASYAYNAAHEFYSDLTGVVAAETAALASKTFGVVATGVFDAANATVTAATGDPAVALALFVDRGGAPTADNLLAYLELSATVTPNGGDITIAWSDSGIFGI